MGCQPGQAEKHICKQNPRNSRREQHLCDLEDLSLDVVIVGLEDVDCALDGSGGVLPQEGCGRSKLAEVDGGALAHIVPQTCDGYAKSES